MTVTDDPGRNLAQFVAMVGELDRYLELGKPYRGVVADWPGGGRQTVTLSLGVVRDLVTALERDAERLVPAERADFEAARERLRAVRSARREAYGAMLRHELRSQLDSWRWFVDDCARDEDAAADRYPREVATRLRIEGLLEEAATVDADAADAQARATSLDDALRRHFASGAYCGPSGQAAHYGPERYWWLYGRPTSATRSARRP